MDTTGTFNVNAGVGVNIKGGSGASSIGISNNDANNYFLWAGHGTPASAPFSVKMDGSVRATKIQHEYSHTYWDMTEYRNSTTLFPAEFWVYIPSGYAIDSVVFSYKATKFKSFARGTSGGSGSTGSQVGDVNVGTPSPDAITGAATDLTVSHTHNFGHQHSVGNHTHDVGSHTHGMSYGIYEDPATLPSSYEFYLFDASGDFIGFDVGGSTKTVDLASVWATPMTAGWNKITVQCGSGQAKITAFVSVKVTPT